MVSDGLQTRVGTLTAGTEWFKRWCTIDGEEEADLQLTELQVTLEGVCAPDSFLTLFRDFIVFEDDSSGRLVKKMADYHQFHAVRVAVEETLRTLRAAKGSLSVYWRSRTEARRCAGRLAHRGDLAYPGVRQEPDHGLLRWGHCPRTFHVQSHHRGADRPQRPG